jgi:hypothetical protein
MKSTSSSRTAAPLFLTKLHSGSGQLSDDRRECVGDRGAEDEAGQAELVPATLDLNPALNVSMVAHEAPGSGLMRWAGSPLEVPLDASRGAGSCTDGGRRCSCAETRTCRATGLLSCSAAYRLLEPRASPDELQLMIIVSSVP